MHNITGSSLLESKACLTCITMLTHITLSLPVIIRTVIIQPISCRDLITEIISKL